jgi:catalase
MLPLLIAPHGGKVGDLAVQRTFATARPVEYDAIMLAAAPRVGTVLGVGFLR